MVFYAVTGGKVLKRLQSSKKMGRAGQLRRTTRRILIGGGFLLFWIIVAILFVSGVAYQPIGIPIVFAVLFGILDVASLMNILAFEVPEAHSSRSGSTASMKRHSVNHSTASDTATTGPTSLV
jgi:membrane glycosyltransferase